MFFVFQSSLNDIADENINDKRCNQGIQTKCGALSNATLVYSMFNVHRICRVRMHLHADEETSGIIIIISEMRIDSNRRRECIAFMLHINQRIACTRWNTQPMLQIENQPRAHSKCNCSDSDCDAAAVVFKMLRTRRYNNDVS